MIATSTKHHLLKSRAQDDHRRDDERVECVQSDDAIADGGTESDPDQTEQHEEREAGRDDKEHHRFDDHSAILLAQSGNDPHTVFADGSGSVTLIQCTNRSPLSSSTSMDSVPGVSVIELASSVVPKSVRQPRATRTMPGRILPVMTR